MQGSNPAGVIHAALAEWSIAPVLKTGDPKGSLGSNPRGGVFKGEKKMQGNIKIYQVNDVDRFFKTIEECIGKVELITDDGDCLNLKSRLTQFISFSKLFSNGTMSNLMLRVSEQKDQARLIDFLIHDKVSP